MPRVAVAYGMVCRPHKYSAKDRNCDRSFILSIRFGFAEVDDVNDLTVQGSFQSWKSRKNYPLFLEERPWSVLSSECDRLMKVPCNHGARDARAIVRYRFKMLGESRMSQEPVEAGSP